MSSQDFDYYDSVRAAKFQQLMKHQEMFGPLGWQASLVGVEIMPEPSETTIGQARHLLLTIEELQKHQPQTPEEAHQIIRRQGVLGKTPGYDRLEAYAAVEFHFPLTSKVIEEIILRLSRQLGYSPLEEVADLGLSKVVAMLTKDNPPEAPQASVSDHGEGTANLPSTSRESKPDMAGIDYQALADSLRKMKQPTRAALVEFMADKDSATALDVAKAVHDDELASDKTMSRNASRTNDSLRDMGSRLYFELKGGTMHRGNRPE